MNNNIIKSLRRTVLGTVAAAAVAIGFTACAEDTFMTQNGAASANGNSYKISIPANIGGGDTLCLKLPTTSLCMISLKMRMAEKKKMMGGLGQLFSILMQMVKLPIWLESWALTSMMTKQNQGLR